MDEISLVDGLKGITDGELEYTRDCLQFYTSKSLKKHKPLTWLPWKYPGHPAYSSFGTNISDRKFRELIDLFRIEVEKMDRLNNQWAEVFTRFFGVSQPQTAREQDKFARKIRNHRKRKGPTWMEEAECQQLLDTMRPIIDEIERLKPQIDQSLIRVYGHLLVTDEDMGDERAKDLIDIVDGIPDSNPKKAIKLLRKALSYGETGIQASKAYLGLGMRYEDLGDIDQAIENYGRVLDAYDPFGMVYFWRGRLYFQQQKWKEARSDFEKALAFPLEDGLSSPEREEAEHYLEKLKNFGEY